MSGVFDEDLIEACHGDHGAHTVAYDFHLEERFDQVCVYEDLRFGRTSDHAFFVKFRRNETVELNDVGHDGLLGV